MSYPIQDLRLYYCKLSAGYIEPIFPFNSEKSEEASKSLKQFNRESIGRPRLEIDQPDLIKSILDILQVFSATDDRRRSEIIRTVKTLSDLQSELSNLGYKISRTATYYR